MKIIQINCVYEKGSTGGITKEIHEFLKNQNHESVVLYGRGKRKQNQNVYKTCTEIEAKINNAISRITGIMYGGCIFSTSRLISRIKKEKPDVVHLHCINGYFVNIYRLVNWLKRYNIKTVLTLHAEFMYTANCGHARLCDKWQTQCSNCERYKEETKSVFLDRTKTSFKKMKNAFDGWNDKLIVVSVSPWLKARAESSVILKNKNHRIVYNGINTHSFRNSGLDQKSTKEEKIIFHCTAHFSNREYDLKGGRYLIELAKRMKGMPVKFIIAGKNEIERSLDIPDNIILLGEIENNTKLADYYGKADLTLLTSERETFSMPCIESLCCGTPVVGFKAGGPESIAIEEFTEFVEFGNIDLLEECVKKWLCKNNDRVKISKLAQGKYSSIAMAQKYVEVYQRLMDED